MICLHNIVITPFLFQKKHLKLNPCSWLRFSSFYRDKNMFHNINKCLLNDIVKLKTSLRVVFSSYFCVFYTKRYADSGPIDSVISLLLAGLPLCRLRHIYFTFQPSLRKISIVDPLVKRVSALQDEVYKPSAAHLQK